MQIAQQVVSLARSLRNNVRLKVRQPLLEIIVASPSKSVRNAIMDSAEIIKEEINVKEISTIEKSSELVVRKVKPHFKKLGPKVGKMMKKVADILVNLNEETVTHLESSGEITLDVEGSQVHVLKDDVEFIEEIKQENLVVAREGNNLVALNISITDELEMEGMAREFVNRIQNLRKEAGFEVTDRIIISYDAPEKIRNAIVKLTDYIMSETLAVEINSPTEGGDIQKEIEINGMKLVASLKKKK
jgi:isoleucyl-tRNA synthetase